MNEAFKVTGFMWQLFVYSVFIKPKFSLTSGIRYEWDECRSVNADWKYLKSSRTDEGIIYKRFKNYFKVGTAQVIQQFWLNGMV